MPAYARFCAQHECGPEAHPPPFAGRHGLLRKYYPAIRKLTQEPVERTTSAPGERRALNSLRSISDTVRVDIRKLDELMNLVGELVIQRGAVGEIVQRLLSDSSETARIGSDLSQGLQESLDRKLKGLQASVLDVRMVPLRQVFDKVSRVIRETCAANSTRTCVSKSAERIPS